MEAVGGGVSGLEEAMEEHKCLAAVFAGGFWGAMF